MFYLSGDNNLSGEVLHALDMIETVGSSPQVNLVALVDGHPGHFYPYDGKWSGTHLVHVKTDSTIGQIVSPVIESYGERNLGDPQTLSDFVRTSLAHFPADRYLFCTFAHGKGIINTDRFSGVKPYKSLSISSDDTNQAVMTQHQFTDALKAGLGDRKLELMVMFSCLTNMVEIAYSLSEVTRYLVASEDEIRLLNDPPGSFQLRGIAFENFLQPLKADPAIPAQDLARTIIDSFIEPYQRRVAITDSDGSTRFSRFSAGLALIDCRFLPGLARHLDLLGQTVIGSLNSDRSAISVVSGMHAALSVSQSYQSFLNLEYYDLVDLLQNWQRLGNDADISRICRDTLDYLQNNVIMYEKHTQDCRSNGISIYLSNYLVPENIYTAHQQLYRESRFSRDSGWHRLIEQYRQVMKTYYPDILIDECALAYARSDLVKFEKLSCRIIWALRHQVQSGRFESARRYIRLLDSVNPHHIPVKCLHDFQQILQPKIDETTFAKLSGKVDRLMQKTAGR